MALRFSLLLHLLRNPQNSNVEEMFNWVHLFPLCTYRGFTFFISDEMQYITKFWNMTDLSGWTQTLRSCLFNMDRLEGKHPESQQDVIWWDKPDCLWNSGMICPSCGLWLLKYPPEKLDYGVEMMKTVCWTWLNFECNNALPLPEPTRCYLDEILPPLPT